jgi:hypothetical protein
MPELPKVPPSKLPKRDGEVRLGGLGTGRVVCPRGNKAACPALRLRPCPANGRPRHAAQQVYPHSCSMPISCPIDTQSRCCRWTPPPFARQRHIPMHGVLFPEDWLHGFHSLPASTLVAMSHPRHIHLLPFHPPTCLPSTTPPALLSAAAQPAPSPAPPSAPALAMLPRPHTPVPSQSARVTCGGRRP